MGMKERSQCALGVDERCRKGKQVSQYMEMSREDRFDTLHIM